MNWIFPQDVDGWLTIGEGRALADAAKGKTVLEIGSYCGRSTICMAQTAKRVYAVDTFDGRATPNARDTEKEFYGNLEKFGVADKVVTLKGTSGDRVPSLASTFDLAFIDAAHDYESVTLDSRLAASKLKHDGLLAFHDYARPANENVTRAVHDILRDGAFIGQRFDNLLFVDPATAFTHPVVFLALPHRNDFSQGTLHAVLNTGGGHKVIIREKQNSLLPVCFNSLWCDALNMRNSHGLTHFAMLHCDIGPQGGWLEILLAELNRTGADILSAVSPIKDERGASSTAIRDPVANTTRRLTMTEVCKLPMTFDAAGAGYPGQYLLANTGCWICDFTKPWVEEMVFREQDTIIRQEDGTFRPACLSEDWLFSLDAHRLGLQVMATRSVQLLHKGEFNFPNFVPWGKWETDPEIHEPALYRAEEYETTVRGSAA